ncbi:MAG: BTAD domain-containing putative transcriptional regulator [Kibdelosporangium sp.]
MWRGPALSEVAADDFFAPPAARLTDLRLTAIEDRVHVDIRLGHATDLVPELTALTKAHPLRERMIGALMRALTAAGRSAEALAVYERARQALADALGADPSSELAALHTAILRGDVPALTGRPDVRRTLRAGLTSFVGRDADLAQVAKLVGDHRLVTLIGPGGSGKTRLATEAARAQLDQQPDGVWLVELAPVTAELPRAVLSALGIGESGGDPADQLVAALRARTALLVLDNCEHVIDAAARLAGRLLSDCPRLRILATSREPLGIIGEALWPVESLALPPQHADTTEAMSYAAVRLFADRASATRPGFEVTDRVTPAIVRVCRALDGMPLAIELAAARMRVMTADQLAARLDDRFQLLTAGNRTALPRHQTLRAVIDWSWDLLSDRERTILRRLAVFARGATIAAAEQVCGDNALDVLDALTDKSLLIPIGDRTPRYGMLETIKEYSLRRLIEAGELDQVRRAHAAYFVELVENADPHLRGAEQLVWLDVLTDDHDNIDAAMRTAVLSGDAGTAVRLVAAAGWYWLLGWWLRGRKSAGADMTGAALALPGGAEDAIRATACVLSAMFNLSGNGDETKAKEWFTTARGLSRRHDERHPFPRLIDPLHQMFWVQDPQDVTYPFDDEDPWVRAMARLARATTLLALGRSHVEAEADLVEALATFQSVGDRWGIAYALNHLSDLLAWRGDLQGAVVHCEQAISVVTEFVGSKDVWKPRLRLVQLRWLLGDRDGVASAMATAEQDAGHLGLPEALASVAYAKAELARWAGDSSAARTHLAQVAALTGDIGLNWQFRAMLLTTAGYLDAREGNVDGAREHRAEALSWALRSTNAFCVGLVLVGAADQALLQNQPLQAVALLAASDAIRGTRDRSLPDVAWVEAAVRAAVTDDQFVQATLRGRAATIGSIREMVSPTLGSRISDMSARST